MKPGDLWKSILPRLRKIWGSYRPLLLVVLAGIILLMLPTGGTPAEQEEQPPPEEDRQILSPVQEEKRLEELLSKIQGVGRVRVMLTMEDSGTKIYAQEKSENLEQSDDSTRENRTGAPVVYSASGGGEEPLLERTRTPCYRGAVIVCDGGGDPEIQLSLLRSMASLLGLSSDRVSVLPMDPTS